MQKLAALLLLVAINGIAAPPAVIPAVQTQALDGHTVSLPRDLGAATVLIVGFSRKSAEATTAWEKPVRGALAGRPAIGFYDMAMLAEVPRFVRPMVVGGIRRQVPDALKPNFVPLMTEEAAWRQVTGYSNDAPDAAYVLLVDRMGAVRWQTHEAFRPDRLAALTTAAAALAQVPAK